MAKQKLRADYIHFTRRLYERYGLDITQSEYKNIVHLISNNLWQEYCIKKSSGSRSLYRIPFGGEMIEVVYSNSQKSLVTVFPGEG